MHNHGKTGKQFSHPFKHPLFNDAYSSDSSQKHHLASHNFTDVTSGQARNTWNVTGTILPVVSSVIMDVEENADIPESCKYSHLSMLPFQDARIPHKTALLCSKYSNSLHGRKSLLHRKNGILD